MLCFNSSLVRLGGRNNCRSSFKKSKFQFQLGAIGSLTRAEFEKSETVVSIPAWCDWEFTGFGKFSIVEIVFQFQLGAIGRPDRLNKHRNRFHVSIPAWCDWEFILNFWFVSFDRVSIPAWCDWEIGRSVNSDMRESFNSSLVRLGAAGVAMVALGTAVSIPAWCDWETKIFLCMLIFAKFQFQLGAIGSNNRKMKKNQLLKFQFQLGAIGSLWLFAPKRFLNKFQFQLGAIGRE